LSHGYLKARVCFWQKIIYKQNTKSRYVFKSFPWLGWVATSIFRMRLLHGVAFSKKLRWLALTKVTRWKRLSQLSFRHRNLWLKNIFLSQCCVPKCLVWRWPKVPTNDNVHVHFNIFIMCRSWLILRFHKYWLKTKK